MLRDVVLSLMSLEDREKTRTIATATTAVICVIFLLATKELSEKYKHKLPRGVPIPGEIIVVSCKRFPVGFRGELYHKKLIGLFKPCIRANMVKLPNVHASGHTVVILRDYAFRFASSQGGPPALSVKARSACLQSDAMHAGIDQESSCSERENNSGFACKHGVYMIFMV